MSPDSRADIDMSENSQSDPRALGGRVNPGDAAFTCDIERRRKEDKRRVINKDTDTQIEQNEWFALLQATEMDVPLSL